MPDIDYKFQQIKLAYAELERKLKDSGKGLVYRTDKGIYGTTNLDAIFKFFKEIGLQNYRHFMDLGCGDGRVVLVASLFTESSGVEFDTELLVVGREIRDRIGLKADLLPGDYMNFDLSDYDIIFMNPDHEFGKLDAKLRSELRGTLFIFNEIFAPNSLAKGKKYWAGQIPIVKYTNCSVQRVGSA